MLATSSLTASARPQFSTRSLFGFTALASIAAACSHQIGIPAAGLLVLFAAALACRFGLLALAIFAAASLSCGWQPPPPARASFDVWRQSIILALAVAGCLWAQLAQRRRRQ